MTEFDTVFSIVFFVSIIISFILLLVGFMHIIKSDRKNKAVIITVYAVTFLIFLRMFVSKIIDLVAIMKL